MFFVVGMALRARRRPVVTGTEELPGSTGILLEDCDGTGWARVHGETWQVHCRQPLNKGRRIRVVGKTGLTLDVEPIDHEGD
jgi:membrane-bound serine protease (ClpP class)